MRSRRTTSRAAKRTPQGLKPRDLSGFEVRAKALTYQALTDQALYQALDYQI